MIRTDYQSIKEIFPQVVHTPDQQVYIRKLLGFYFRIEYKPRHTNHVVDCLSRLHEPSDSSDTLATKSNCFPLSSRPDSGWMTILRHENTTLTELLNLHQQSASGTLAPHYFVKDDVLFY